MTNPQIVALLAELQDAIMGSTLVKCAATDLGIQWAGWALASAFRTEKFYDLAGNENSDQASVSTPDCSFKTMCC